MTAPTTAKGIFSDGTSPDRDEHDLYETPRGFTRALLDREKFHTEIWEPAAAMTECIQR